MNLPVRHIFLLLFITLSAGNLKAQLSPGDLSDYHSSLEGISGCTKCHVLGNKISSEKCLACHTEIRQRISEKKGYHSSSEVSGKECFSCHSEHNGKKFQIVHFDLQNFNHSFTGYTLSAPHAKKECKDCHNTGYVKDKSLINKKFTYLGLKTECLTCHVDYHQQTLSSSCTDCHNPDSFKPAGRFNHSNARYPLKGKHSRVECSRCHKVETVNGKKFQEFRGVLFASCVNCHKDPHQDKFGQNCRQCHSEESFNAIKTVNNFDHNKTKFRLEEKHQTVSCNACHKTKFTDPLKYDRCIDCHKDYHEGQFSRNGISPDCSHCHSVKGFNTSSYTSEQHKSGNFPLTGSHAAVPCTECHRKTEKWSFRKIGIRCVDCHNDLHKTFISAEFYPDENCKACHNETTWTNVSFEHSGTGFLLTGGHAGIDCRKCHFRPDTKGLIHQKFSGLSKNCSDCHNDNHNGQFEVNGATDCSRCHEIKVWKAMKFDHNTTGFKLDGQHAKVPCASCHRPIAHGSLSYVDYKIKEYKCESCH